MTWLPRKDQKRPNLDLFIWFLVGATSFKGKMLDSHSDFFVQTTDLTLIGYLFTETTKTTEAKSRQLKLSAKGPPFIFNFLTLPTKPDETKGSTFLFFRRCETFFVCKGSSVQFY